MIDREQRRDWQEERVRRGLVPGAPGFGRAGLMARLDLPGALVTSLPSDPLCPALDLEESLLPNSVLPDRFSGLTANGVSMLHNAASGSEAAIKFAHLGGEDAKWRAFAALRQDGGIEVGMGSVTRFKFQDGSPLAGRTAYRLFVLVHALRVVVESQARLLQQREKDNLGPFELVVGIPEAGGAVLEGFADGWDHPEYDFEVQTCLETDVLLRHEVDPWPTAQRDQEALVGKMAARVCRCFSVDVNCFLPRLPAGLGVLSRDYA